MHGAPRAWKSFVKGTRLLFIPDDQPWRTDQSGQCSERSKWVIHHLDLCSQPAPDITEPPVPRGKGIALISGSFNFHKAHISRQKNIFSRVGPLLELFCF